jgi:hypothetical protein
MKEKFNHPRPGRVHRRGAITIPFKVFMGVLGVITLVAVVTSFCLVGYVIMHPESLGEWGASVINGAKERLSGHP